MHGQRNIKVYYPVFLFGESLIQLSTPAISLLLSAPPTPTTQNVYIFKNRPHTFLFAPLQFITN